MKKIYRLLKYILIIIIFSTFIQPYSIDKSIAQQPYPLEWYVPKLWEVEKKDTTGFEIIEGIPFKLQQWNERTILTRLNRNNGQPIWFQILPNMYHPKKFDQPDYWEITYLKIGNNKMFYFDTFTMKLLCIDVNLGTILWSIYVDEQCFFESYQIKDYSSPMPICDKVLISISLDFNKSILFCFNSEKGRLLWKNENTDYLISIIKLCDDKIYCAANHLMSVNCIDFNDGKTLWKSKLYTSWDVLYLGISKTNVYLFIWDFWTENSYILVFNKLYSSDVLEKKKLPGLPFAFINDSIVYKDIANKEYVCYEITNGKELWRRSYGEIELELYPNPTLYENGLLFRDKTTKQMLSIDPETGDILWQTKIDIDISFYQYGRFYATNNNKLICFGDPAIDYPEPPSRISDSMGTP